tara:strand:+ start:7705 stop:8001 length:297 start_codon:yes stop_codon:yes gene_type:complete
MTKQEISEKTNTSIELLNRVQIAMRKTWQYMGYEVEQLLEEEGLTVTNRRIVETIIDAGRLVTYGELSLDDLNEYISNVKSSEQDLIIMSMELYCSRS